MEDKEYTYTVGQFLLDNVPATHSLSMEELMELNDYGFTEAEIDYSARHEVEGMYIYDLETEVRYRL